MMIKGFWYPAGSSARYEAELRGQGTRYELVILDDISEDALSESSASYMNDGSFYEGQGASITGALDDMTVSDRVGNIPRKITLHDHSIFETQDNDAVDQVLQEIDHKDGKLHFLHVMETRWRWIVPSLIATVVFVFVGVVWGIPWASKNLADAMPVSVSEAVSEGALEIMDRTMLDESEIPEERQNAIRKRFNEKLLSVQSGQYNYRLYFRKMDDVPNAFALPSGEVVITDGLIKLATKPEQIDSVLLHEIGHVVHRHGLEQIVRSSIMTVILTAFLGDATAVEELVIALPAFLLESSYSRDHESEADEFAFKKMVELGIDPAHFADMFEKMTHYGKTSDVDDENTSAGNTDNTQAEANTKTSSKTTEYNDLLSTHPSSPLRMQRAREYSTKHFHNNGNE